MLTWASSEGADGDVFTIQRSADGIKFETLTEVPGGSDAEQHAERSYHDRQPLKGLAYYRLVKISGDVNVASVTILLEGQGVRKRTF